MKEFDLRKYLAEGRLLKEEEKKVSDKARREAEEEGYEDGYNDAVEDAKDALDKIKDETEEEKDKKKGVKEEMKDKSMEDDTMKEEMDDTINPGNTKEDQAKKDAYDYDARPAHMKEEEMKDKKEKLTKEGLRNLIKEKITSILTEDEEVEDNVDVDVEKDVDVNVKDKEEVDVDKESEESDIEVKSELPGESADTSAVLGLLTKAQEEAEEMNDEVLMDQIGNTITYFTRKHVVKASNEKLEEEINELFGFGKKKRASSGGGSKGHAVFAYGKDGGKRRIGNGLTAKDARRDADWQRYRRNFAVDKFEVVNLDNDQVVDTMKG